MERTYVVTKLIIANEPTHVQILPQVLRNYSLERTQFMERKVMEGNVGMKPSNRHPNGSVGEPNGTPELSGKAFLSNL